MLLIGAKLLTNQISVNDLVRQVFLYSPCFHTLSKAFRGKAPVLERSVTFLEQEM